MALALAGEWKETRLVERELSAISTRPRAPSPGVAAVLSVLLPGLGQVYAGRLGAGALWFLGTMFAYWAILIPGFLVHAVCIWSAYRSAREFERY
jgi:TM2 domain-containing membrane protein YozV